MENFTYESPDSVNRNEFQEDENDSDLEGRLYAEIYYSNEVYDPGENFHDGMKTISIQNNRLQLENPNDLNNSSDKNCSPRNDQAHLVSTEKEKMLSNVDKNLNFQKQVNLEAQISCIQKENVDKVIDENVNPQEKPDKNRTLQQKTPKQKKNQTPTITNEETEDTNSLNFSTPKKPVDKEKQKKDDSSQVLNNVLTTAKARKRTSEMDKDSGGKSKRWSFESDKNILNITPKRANRKSDRNLLTPASLIVRKSSDNTNLSPLISPATMAILFPPESKKGKRKESNKNEEGIKKKIKATQLKNQVAQKSVSLVEVSPIINSKQSKKAQKLIQSDKIIEVASSDSSDDSSDEDLLIAETPKIGRQKKNAASEKNMPIWLDVCSDSDESIFEVPVPPKPPPLVIDLNDSTSLSSDSDNSSSDGIYDVNSESLTTIKGKFLACSNSNSSSDSEENSEDNSRVPKETPQVISIDNSTQNSVENSVESPEENLRSRLPSEQSNSVDENLYSNYSNIRADAKIDSIDENLILNCTEVQKSAKSLEKTQKIQKDTVSEEVEESENVLPTDYNEYIESLNDIAEPSTSKASAIFTEKKSHKKKKRKYKSSKEKTDEEYFFEPMPDKMKAFYDDSWGGEEFSVEETQSQMQKDPRCWAIMDEDWNPILLKRQRYFLSKNKCTLCRQSGHLRANCPEPKKRPVCHMCGTQGHYETRCPEKHCLTCGTKQNTFRQTCESCRNLFCTLCRSRGHKKDSCPDLWRQYHHTTSETEYQPPMNSSDVMKPSNLLFCCNCTMQGHESSSCNKYRWTQHYPTPSHITSYHKCSKMLSTTSSNPIQVVNLTESAGELSQNLVNDVELVNISNAEMSQTPENDNLTTTQISKALPAKILFEVKIQKKDMNKEKLLEHHKHKGKDEIVLSYVQGANLEGLIAGTIIPTDLKKLSRKLKCDICIKLFQGKKVVMNITYYKYFHRKDIFKKLILFWVRLSDEEKKSVKLFVLKMKKNHILFKLNKTFKIFDSLSGDIKVIYKEVETLTNKLKRVTPNTSKKQKRKFRRIKMKRDMSLSKLVKLLYKNNYVVEKGIVSNLRKLNNELKQNNLCLDVYLLIIYYYNLIFAKYRPSNLEEMVQNYLALNEGSSDRLINNSVASKNLEVIAEKYSNEAFTDQQHVYQSYNDQDHVDQQHFDQNYVHQEPVAENFHQNRLPLIPSLFDINPQNLEQSISLPGSSNTPQKQNEQYNQFQFPTDDFIPISDHHPSQFLESNAQFNNWRKSRQYGINPMHNLKTFDPRAPQTSDGLLQEAAYLINKALEFNKPQITKYGLLLCEMINKNKLQRKHINHFRRLMNSSCGKGFR